MLVFKYRGYNHRNREDRLETFNLHLKSLEENYFWSPSRHDLNDPFEGINDLETFRQGIEQIIKVGIVKENNNKFKNYAADLINQRDLIGIFSLAKRPPHNELLWSHYAGNHSGFCVGYDFNILKSCQNFLHSFDVRYRDHPPSPNITDIYPPRQNLSFFEKLLGVKSKAWSYEDEIRILTSTTGIINHPPEAIKQIYFGLKMDKEESELIMDRLAKRNIKFYQVVHSQESYIFKFDEINHT